MRRQILSDSNKEESSNGRSNVYSFNSNEFPEIKFKFIDNRRMFQNGFKFRTRRTNSLGFLWLLGAIILSQDLTCCGGNCWTSMNSNGKCSSLYKLGATKDECCGSTSILGNSVSASYSDEILTSSSIFYMHIQGGVPCSRCKETCESVKCPDNRKCIIRNGHPKCICAPNCTAFRLQNGMEGHPGGSGLVCGTDGKVYKNTCRLLKRSCRQGMLISVAYTGPCKTSCSKVTCRGTKQCLVDQNLIPHCVHCPDRVCPAGDEEKPEHRFVCGTDGLTYPSLCHLRQAACRRGKAIPVAYKGSCKKKATCSTVYCAEGQSCLTEVLTGKPRCVNCTRSRWCKKYQRDLNIGPICSTNGKSYKNWCEMQDDACATLTALDTKHIGSCAKRRNNTVED